MSCNPNFIQHFVPYHFGMHVFKEITHANHRRMQRVLPCDSIVLEVGGDQSESRLIENAVYIHSSWRDATESIPKTMRGEHTVPLMEVTHRNWETIRHITDSGDIVAFDGRDMASRWRVCPKLCKRRVLYPSLLQLLRSEREAEMERMLVEEKAAADRDEKEKQRQKAAAVRKQRKKEEEVRRSSTAEKKK